MATVTVTIKSMKFNPNPASVKKGDSVIWSNEDKMQHTATANGGSFNVTIAPGGKSTPVTFNSPGDVPYHCEIHPSMKGTVKVS